MLYLVPSHVLTFISVSQSLCQCLFTYYDQLYIFWVDDDEWHDLFNYVPTRVIIDN